MQKSKEFPAPAASDIFYAGYCLYKTARTGGQLVAAGDLDAAMLAREMNAARKRIQRLSPASYSTAIAHKLQGTLSFALRELDLRGLSFDDANRGGESEYAQAYLTGPVEAAGADIAMKLGWLLGEPPNNPFNDIAVLEAGWRQADMQRDAATRQVSA